MLSKEKMVQQVSKYQISFDMENKEVFIAKDGNDDWVNLTYKRAIEWVEAGIDDLDCRSQEKMLTILNSWVNQ